MKDIDTHPNENIIKAALINNYAHINSKPFVVCNELTISEEYKIVDLVFCKDHLSYAYEIKAWNDDMRRLPSQLDVYCKLFDYVYVATTTIILINSNQYLTLLVLFFIQQRQKKSYINDRQKGII